MRYSIHTFEIKKYIDEYEYRRICELFSADAHLTCYRIKCKNAYFRPYKYKGCGVRIELDREKFQGYVIKIEINLKAVLEPGNDYDVFDMASDNLNEALKKTDEMLQFMGDSYKIDSLKLSRVDCTGDAHLHDEKFVLDVISLAKKSVRCSGFHETYSAEYKRRMKKKYIHENSCDISNTSRGISFVLYSKYRQLVDIGSDDPQKAYGVLRAELKLHSPIVNGATNSELIHYYIQNSRSIISQNVADIFTRGAYLKLDTVRKFIVTQNERKRFQVILLSLFEKVAEKKKFRLGYSALIKEFRLDSRGKKQIQNFLEENAINPVTLSVRKETEGCECLYSILELNDVKERILERALLQKVCYGLN